MKYVAPFGQASDDPYEDGNPAIGRRGSVVPAAAIEHPMREIVRVITGAGLDPDGDNLEQLFEAIQSLIQAATGGGDVSDFVTMTLARARLPIFPEVLTADGRINVTSPGSGAVVVPTGVQYVHRGIRLLTTSDLLEAERSFATAASKVYHLRWRPAPINFGLFDLADAAYNPSSLADEDASFDSTYDDMLVARVVTNASNVATITNLANKTRFIEQHELAGVIDNSSPQSAFGVTSRDINLARTPVVHMSPSLIQYLRTDPNLEEDHDYLLVQVERSRYRIRGQINRDFAHGDFRIFATLFA